jgi:hypothetical protein
MIVSNVAVYSIQEATPEGRIVTLALLILGLAIIPVDSLKKDTEGF